MAMFFPGKSISKIHGTSRTVSGVTYFAMYHPAAALHQGNLREILKQDIKKLPLLLDELKAKTEVIEPAAEVKQLSMF